MAGQFPMELIEQVVDYVWDDPDELDFWWNYGVEYATLCALSLSCSALRWRSQYNLLRRVSLLKMSNLQSFTALLVDHPDRGKLVLELVVLSTMERPSPAESFPPLLAGRLPNLRSLRIRAEIDPVDDLDKRPTILFHRLALPSLGTFSSVTQLQLFGVRFAALSDFLRLLHALRQLTILQCMQIWFRDSLRGRHSVNIPPRSRLGLRSIDLAFIPRTAMGGLLQAVSPAHLIELTITPNRVGSVIETTSTFHAISQFDHLESFMFFVSVTADGAEYTDVVGLIYLLKPHIQTITISHFLNGPARAHVVPKRTLIDAIVRNAVMLQEALDPGNFSEYTRVVFQFQGLDDSEAWWWEQLTPVVPKLCGHKRPPDRPQFFSVENVTYSDWSPWEDDKHLSVEA